MKVQKKQRMQKLGGDLFLQIEKLGGDPGRAVKGKLDSDVNICFQLNSQILLQAVTQSGGYFIGYLIAKYSFIM